MGVRVPGPVARVDERIQRLLRATMACIVVFVCGNSIASENPGDSLVPDFYNDPTLSTSGASATRSPDQPAWTTARTPAPTISGTVHDSLSANSGMQGAEVFLVPEGNCAEAVQSAPEGLPLVEVGTLSQALTALEALREGEQPELCPAG